MKARPRKEKLGDLRYRLDSGEIEAMHPFGVALDGGLRNAKLNAEDHFAYWEEEDYCHPPLAQEREAILDNYFDDLGSFRGCKKAGPRVEANRKLAIDVDAAMNRLLK